MAGADGSRLGEVGFPQEICGFLFGDALSTSQFIAIVGATIALGMLARLKAKQGALEPPEATA